MSKTEILVICRHPDILQTVLRLINNNPDLHATGAITDEEAIAMYSAQSFQLILLGSGIEQKSEENLRAFFKAQKPGIIIIQHYGGGSGLLAAEIYEGLKGN